MLAFFLLLGGLAGPIGYTVYEHPELRVGPNEVYSKHRV